MCKQEIWSNILNYEVIKLLINLLANTDKKDIYIENYYINGNLFNIELLDNELVIKCSDHRELHIKILYSERKKRMSSFVLNNDKGYALILYKFNDEFLKICSENLGINKNEYKNISEEKMFDKIVYTLDKENFVNFGNRLNEFIYKYHRFCINDDTIQFQYNAKLLVTSDFKRIIKYNDRLLPSLEEIKKFDYANELEKIRRLIVDNELDFHKFTLDYLTSRIRVSDELQQYKEAIIDSYENSLDFGKEGFNFYKRFLNLLETRTFTYEELKIVLELLDEKINNKTINNDCKVLSKQLTV